MIFKCEIEMKKIFILVLSALITMPSFASKEGGELYNKISAEMTVSTDLFMSSLDDLNTVNGFDKDIIPEDGFVLKYPASVKEKISKAMKIYLDDLDNAIKQTENFLKGNKECLLQINDFKKIRITELRKYLDDYIRSSVSTEQEIKKAWSNIMDFAIRPGVAFSELSMTILAKCMLL